MSMLLMVKAMQAKVGNPLRKLVLIKLADNANDDGECWPSYKHIADHCEISRSTVKNHVRELEKMGLLYREYRRDGKANKSNMFHLTIDKVGQQMTEGRVANDLGGGAADDPRTSHLLEPVKEPNNIVQNPVDDAFDYFWLNMKMVKNGKQNAQKAFAKQVKLQKSEPLDFAKFLVKDTKLRHGKQQGFDALHPSTYLNQQRWTDQQPAQQPANQGYQTKREQYDDELGRLIEQEFEQRGMF